MLFSYADSRRAGHRHAEDQLAIEGTPLIFIGLLALVIWAFPIFLIAGRADVPPKEKAIWIFAVIFVSWLAWILFLFVAPVMDERRG